MSAAPDEPAFPVDEIHGNGIQEVKKHLGLSARQYTAIEIAKGLAGAPDTWNQTFDQVSERAIRQADSLLAKLANATPLPGEHS